ncbi:hypothetical protein EsH8_II_001535 [Colletotrichum jinshuiense]
MSTFNGLVAEFPDIRIDFFRKHVNRCPPLACFLSHVHSDHLAGLESLRSPFVYCSAATREMLLRLERHPCRINYAKGILEARVQTYKHLKNLLKPLPLETPTTLELAPGSHIQVTLFDANHCPGSVMFLIEDSYHAVLYTGDIRSEPWFVNTIARNPAVLEYTSGIKTLDKVYLDTSFIQDVPFQTKAEGLAELLRKVALYPDDTIFHIQAWTYGYEQVWIALSKALKSRIHVDDYKMRIFSSLAGTTSNDRFSSSIHLCPEAPALAGYVCGNTPHPGCLTRDENVRLHSCERGNFCTAIRKSAVVFIQPVITHLPNGADIVEAGVGGGGGDLERDAELDPLTSDDIKAVLTHIDEKADLSEDARSRLLEFLETSAKTGRNMSLDLDITSFGEKNQAAIIDAFRTAGRKDLLATESLERTAHGPAEHLPGIITFPYSRHSSYEELCDLVRVFRPRDVWPCTVNTADWLRDGVTIKSLFGKHCSGDVFEHDLEMEKLTCGNAEVVQQQASQGLESSQLSADGPDATASHFSHNLQANGPRSAVVHAGKMVDGHSEPIETHTSAQTQHNFHSSSGESWEAQEASMFYEPTIPLHPYAGMSRIRADAYLSMQRNILGDEWTPIGLLSTLDHHTTPDKNL